MASRADYYAVLGVSPVSDDVVIRAAFRALMLKHHPDTNRSADATERAAAMNEAFGVLGDPQRRAAYDASLGRGAGSPSAPPPAPPSPPPPPKGPARPQPIVTERAASGLLARLVGILAVLLVVVAVKVGIRAASQSLVATPSYESAIGP